MTAPCWPFSLVRTPDLPICPIQLSPNPLNPFVLGIGSLWAPVGRRLAASARRLARRGGGPLFGHGVAVFLFCLLFSWLPNHIKSLCQGYGVLRGRFDTLARERLRFFSLVSPLMPTPFFLAPLFFLVRDFEVAPKFFGGFGVLGSGRAACGRVRGAY